MARYLALSLAATTLLLAGCGEPSQAEIDQAMKDSLRSTNGTLTGVFGDSAKLEIRDVRKLGCEKSSPSGYRCDVEWTSVVPVLGESKKRGTLNLMKGSEGWALTQ